MQGRKQGCTQGRTQVLVTGALVALSMWGLSGCGSSDDDVQGAGVEKTVSPAPGAETSSGEGVETPPPTASAEERSRATASLRQAVRAGDVEAARAAVAAGADLEARGANDRTPVVEATKTGQDAIAVLLLESGADPDAKDDIADSAFLYAGAEGLDEILAASIAGGADVTSTNRFGGTALIPASEHAHLDAMRMLIEAGVPLDHVNDLGWTALHEAIVLGSGGSAHQKAVAMLLDAGASPTIPDGDGRSPRDLAAGRGYDEIVALLDARL